MYCQKLQERRQKAIGVSKSILSTWRTSNILAQSAFRFFGEEKILNADLQLNERVRVHLDITCHEYNGKFYNQISCWKVDRNNEQQVNQRIFPDQTPQQVLAPQQFPPQVNSQGYRNKKTLHNKRKEIQVTCLSNV